VVVENKRITVSDVIANALSDFGVTDVFCVVGGAIAPLSDCFARDSRFEIHYLLHEQSAGIAAEAYASAFGKPAVLLVTSGPGSTNAMTPLVAAWTNSSPLIVLAGQVRSQDVQSAGNNRQWGSQHIDSITMVSPFTKIARRIDPDSVSAYIASDLQIAISRRPGPVWFEIPVDVQRAPARRIYATRQKMETVQIEHLTDFSDSLVAAVKEAIQPLILLGNGCRSQLDATREFINQLNWPVQLTWPSLDFLSTNDPLYAGRPGSISTWGANLTIQNADLVLILGARLDWGQVAFRPENFAPNAKLFRVEIDAEEIRRIPGERVHDACASVEEFLLEIGKSDLQLEAQRQDISPWRKQVEQWKQELSSFGSQQPVQGISMYEMLDLISENSHLFPTIVSGSSGTCTEQVMQAISPLLDQRVMNSGGLGSMGFGVAGSIGAYFATKKPVLCLESDGSFAMNPQDIAFIVENNLPIRILIMDSEGYKSMLLSQRRGNYEVAGSDKDSGVYLLNPVAVAKSMGMVASRIDSDMNWKEEIIKFLNSNSPELLQVIVSKEEEAAPRVISKPNAEGRMETAKLDDLWPPLVPKQISKFQPKWRK
jgi:acetolactate synthase I/II/III large subunit